MHRDAWKPPSGMAIGFVNGPFDLSGELDKSDGVAWVMHSGSASDAEEAIAVAQGALQEGDRASFVLVYNGPRHEFDSKLQVEIDSVPGTVDGSLRLRRCQVIKLGGRMCASLATKAASTWTVQQPPTPLKEQRANTFVVRCELDVAFGEESFKKATKFTGSAIRGWAKARGSRHPLRKDSGHVWQQAGGTHTPSDHA